MARMQMEMAEIRAENRLLRTPGVQPVVPTPRQVAFTTTKVPWFGGTTSWEQYQQVFDAIVLSNGWDDAMAALQLLSHLQGDALNVALLVPMARRTSRKGLVDALSAHYGSPGRLADYRRQFEKTTRSAGDDPSIFALALETLAMKAFGDMGHTARLRLICDRFIAGHSSCELRRYLDSVPPETPIRDVVHRCRVWESHADPDIWRVSKPGPELGEGFVTRISSKIRPQDPGGGAAQLAAPRQQEKMDVMNPPEVSVVEPQSAPTRISVVLVEEAKVGGAHRMECPCVDQDLRLLAGVAKPARVTVCRDSHQ